MSKLLILDISGLDLSDISPLAKLPELEWLIMKESNIPGEAIDTLIEMTALKRVSINGATVPAEALAKLRKAKPSLAIDGADVAEQNATPATPEPGA